MKLPQISGIEVVKRLKKLGFVVTRQKGSHVRLEKTGEKVIKLTVPLNNPIKKGTLNRILKDAEITLEEFENLK